MQAVLWIAAAAVLIILEMFGGGFYLACLAVGCLFGALAAALFGSAALSTGIAAVAALAAVIFVRPLAKSRMFGGSAILTNIDAIIGKRAEVVRVISAGGQGRVKIGGEEWPAETDDGAERAVGESLVVKQRRGGTVIVGQP